MSLPLKRTWKSKKMDIVRILYYVLSFIGARLNVDFHMKIKYNNNLHITVNLIRRAASIEAMVGQFFVIRSSFRAYKILMCYTGLGCLRNGIFLTHDLASSI